MFGDADPNTPAQRDSAFIMINPRVEYTILYSEYCSLLLRIILCLTVSYFYFYSASIQLAILLAPG